MLSDDDGAGASVRPLPGVMRQAGSLGKLAPASHAVIANRVGGGGLRTIAPEGGAARSDASSCKIGAAAWCVRAWDTACREPWPH